LAFGIYKFGNLLADGLRGSQRFYYMQLLKYN